MTKDLQTTPTADDIRANIEEIVRQYPNVAELAQPQKVALALYPSCDFNLSEVSRVADIPRRTIFNWMRDQKAFKAVIDDMREVDLDESEARLRGIAHSNHPQALTALIFRLKCLRRQVYGDQVQHGHSGTIRHEHVADPVELDEFNKRTIDVTPEKGDT